MDIQLTLFTAKQILQCVCFEIYEDTEQRVMEEGVR